MNNALLQTLFNDPSGGQIAGGMMMVFLFSSVGVAAAGAFAFVARHVFLGRYEQVFGRLCFSPSLRFIWGLLRGFRLKQLPGVPNLLLSQSLRLQRLLGRSQCLFSLLGTSFTAYGTSRIAFTA